MSHRDFQDQVLKAKLIICPNFFKGTAIHTLSVPRMDSEVELSVFESQLPLLAM
jgi:hypothetical protein